MFITIEEGTVIANLILRLNRLAIRRRLVLSAGIIACDGWVQPESVVVHVMTDWLEDPPDLLRSVDKQDEAFTPVRLRCWCHTPRYVGSTGWTGCRAWQPGGAGHLDPGSGPDRASRCRHRIFIEDLTKHREVLPLDRLAQILGN